MRRVYKYGFPIADRVRLSMPRGAEIVHVAAQGHPAFSPNGEAAFVWALVDPEAITEERRFRLAGTGHDLPDEGLEHVGSFLMQEGLLVFHLFEVTG